MTQPPETSPATPQPQDQPHQPTDDREEVYFEGSPLPRSQLSRMLQFGALGLLLIAIPILAWVYAEQWVYLWWALPCILLAPIVAALPYWWIRSTRYRITNYRIDYERGLLSKRIDTLELWHVEDISFYQSLSNRLMKVGTITIVSHDESTPRLELRGLPNPRQIYENLKQRVIAVKRQRGVIKMDIG